jgi:hypothetical protein
MSLNPDLVRTRCGDIEEAVGRDYGRVFHILIDGLADLRTFAGAIARLI